jgi:hypothetical protein
MSRVLEVTGSWAIHLGVLIGLSCSVDAQLIPLADHRTLSSLSAFPVRSVTATQSFTRPSAQSLKENGFSENTAQLVQRRESSKPDKQPRESHEPDMYQDVQESACAKKIRTMFPAVVFQTSDLALDQARVDHREATVVIPLTEPHEEIRAIWFDVEDVAQALEMIHLLRTGKIGAVSVLPLGHRPSILYMFRGVSKEDREACLRERVVELMGKCTECEVLEWLSLKP